MPAPDKVQGTVRFIDPDLSVPAHERAIFAGPAAKYATHEKIELNDFHKSDDVAKGAKGLDVQAFTFVKHNFSLDRDQMLEGTNAEDVYAKEVLDMMVDLTGASRASEFSPSHS